MGESFTLELRNRPDAIVPASEAAEAWLEQHSAGPEAAYLILLAIEELVTNCIKYAYDDTAEHTIAIVLSADARALTMTFVDDGRPFDPLSAAAPDLDAAAAERSVGGLGIFLLRSLADGMTYERRDGANRLTLTKRMT